jgi:hypothetical protein
MHGTAAVTLTISSLVQFSMSSLAAAEDASPLPKRTQASAVNMRQPKIGTRCSVITARSAILRALREKPKIYRVDPESGSTLMIL